MILNNCRSLQETVKKMSSIGISKTICINDFYELNNEIVKLAEKTFPVTGKNTDEEAEILIYLFMGCDVMLNSNNKEFDHIKQKLLDRAYYTLKELDNSLLKCNLLLHCYAEIREPRLKEEAKEIIVGWGGRHLTLSEIESLEFYNSLINYK